MSVHSLHGRHVVITGAQGGLGPAVVEAFATAGAICHLPQRRPIEDSAPTSRVGGIDLVDEAAVAGFYRSIPQLWASIHVAGGYAAGNLLATTVADLRAQFDLNLVTAFLCCREAVRAMRGAATPAGGRIVNVSSRAADHPAGGSVAYTTAKGAVSILTRAIADEVKGDRILVNAVLPSTIDTPANRKAMPSADHTRWPKPAQLADTILWLASPDNALTSGALIPVYGNT